mgnify:CR=1 FL=1
MILVEEKFLADEEATREAGRNLAPLLSSGSLVLLFGNLGAGKTTFVRGVLEALGHVGPVRSPTFNLLQTFDTDPPVVHADLYRLGSMEGVGLEDYFDSHAVLIEWPEVAADWVNVPDRIEVRLDFHEGGRTLTVTRV